MVNSFIPNIGDIAAGRKELAWPDAVHFDVLLAGHNNTGVLLGCAPTAGGGRDVDIGLGCVIIDGTPKIVGSQTVTLDTGDASPRLDLITIDTSGIIQVEKGTASAVPVYDKIPASRVVIAGVLLGASATTVVTGDINDMRVDLSRRQMLLHRDTTEEQVINTTAQGNIFDYTLAGDAIGTTGGVRVKLAGGLLTAASTNLIIQFILGGSVIFASGVFVFLADVDVREWTAELVIQNITATTQKAYATFNVNPAVPLTFQWELSSTADRRAIIGYDTVAKNTRADQAIQMSAQFSVANGANVISKQMATVERLPPA